MRIPHAQQHRLRLAVLLAFVMSCVLIFSYLWVNMGGTIPGVSSDGYRVDADFEDVDNAVFDSDLRIAGVAVGKVQSIAADGGAAHLTLQLDDASVVPLHEGVTLHLRAKSLVEETYIEIVDGDGAEIPDGALLPADALAEPVQLHDVLTGLDAKTRASLGRSLRALGAGTADSEENISRVMSGLGDLGAEGHDVLDVLAAQSQDLEEMARSLGVMMRSIDERQGEVVGLVKAADDLTGATTDNQQYLSATMTKLPGVLGSVRNASSDLGTLSGALAPVARDLRAAAPALNSSLEQLPAVTRDLRGLMPHLDTVLDRVPATLRRTPVVSRDVSDIVPDARVALADVNPMLGYLAPYQKDLTAFFTNWAAMMANSDANGHYLRIFMVFNETSVKNLPLGTHVGVLDKRNSYPAPGGATNPGPYTGQYPRVEEHRP